MLFKTTSFDDGTATSGGVYPDDGSKLPATFMIVSKKPGDISL